MLPDQCGFRVSPLQPRLIEMAFDQAKTIAFELDHKVRVRDHEMVMVHL